MKLLIFNFDGTGNEGKDAEQESEDVGHIDDKGITNILKFHLLCGGDLKNEYNENASQISFYYPGIATRGNVFQRFYNFVFAPGHREVKTIINKALEDFDDNFKKGDRILLTGFSRGAALARRFASILNKKTDDLEVVEAVFDTVASIGLPNFSKRDRPKSEVVFEEGFTLPPNVKKALHCVSLDDKHSSFQPTLMNRDERVHEIWFPGSHSDVGGGYYYDGLADITFRYMLNWIDELEWDVEFISPVNIDYENLLLKNAEYKILYDDVAIDPNVFGKNHQQMVEGVVGKVILSDRLCCVIQKDARTDLPPHVHHSVAQRITGDHSYLPLSLRGVKHILTYDDGTEIELEGFSVYREDPMIRFLIPRSDKVITTPIFAHLSSNPTGIYLEKGRKYEISVQDIDGAVQQWRDSGVYCDADGWSRRGKKFGVTNIDCSAAEPFRRVPDSNWFSLCGFIDDNCESPFGIGSVRVFEAPASGELNLFANDLKNSFYGNNLGKLIVSVKLVP